MSDFYEISATLQDKFEYIKYRMCLIMFDEKPLEYTPEWNWDFREPNRIGDELTPSAKNYRKLLEDAKENGNQGNMSERAQLAFNDLIAQTKKLDFDFTRQLDFMVFEALFYNLVTDAYMYQRYSAQSEQLISIELAKEYLNDKQYNYISLIYDILQLEFNWWMNYREKFDGNEVLKSTKGYRAGIHLPFGTKEYWNEIKELAANAHDLLPKGELANRIMLISDVQLIYGIGEWKDLYDPANEELVKYLDIRQDTYGHATFILDCFSDDFEDYCKPLGWITGLPHIEGRTSQYVVSSKCHDEKENKTFCDTYYQNTMMFPASIYFPQMDGHFLTSVANEIQYSNYLKETNKELKNKNNALQEAQDEKAQLIARFAHTYKNMRATTLQDIASTLMRFGNTVVRDCARKILVEYAIKQNLTREVEMLQLEFEGKSSVLLQKLRTSTSNNNGKNASELVSDSLQRCFMSLLYGENESDNIKRNLFFGTEEYNDEREALEESFEQNVLIDGESMLTWLSPKQCFTVIVEASGMWNSLRFDKGGYAALLITSWITELLTNAIKYADKTKPIALSFSQQNDLLYIEIRNEKEKAVVNTHGTQQGISSIIASIKRMNYAVNCKREASDLIEDSNSYRLRLQFSSQIFVC